VKILDQLKSIQAFTQLSDADLAQVAVMVREIRVGIGAVLARQGEAGDALYIVSAGRLRTESIDGLGVERGAAEYLEGQWLGEMALLTGEPWGFTATAASDSTLLVLRKQEFDAFLGTNLQAMVQMMKLVAQRQAAARQRPLAPVAAPEPAAPAPEVAAVPVPEVAAVPACPPEPDCPPESAGPAAEASPALPHESSGVASYASQAATAPASQSAAPAAPAPASQSAAPAATAPASQSAAPAAPARPVEPPPYVVAAPPPGPAWVRKPMGKLFTVFSPKGGVGKSTIATNLAVAMAKLHPGSVALLDLSLTFGHDMLLLNLVPRSCVAATTAEALRKMTLEEELSYYLAVHPSSGLRVMAGAVHPEEGEMVSGDTAKAAIDLLRSHFQYVVVDTGSNFADPTLCALESADRVLLLCSPELCVLRDVRECQRILSQVIHLTRERVLYLMNGIFPFKTLSRDQFESTLQQPLHAELPYGGDVPTRAALRGEPFVETQPGSPLARALQRLAAQLTADEQRGSDLQQRDRRRGFFR
jgi:MinD-like ATPase involved in chromosome partitioning or flagellar assembly